MGSEGPVSAEAVICNRLGFHVRPIQRFAEIALAFRGDVQVRIEDRTCSARSVMGLMSLRGRHGDCMCLSSEGEDAAQAVAVLKLLVDNCFYVEDDPHCRTGPDRHLKRLHEVASCFESCATVEFGGASAPCGSVGELAALGMAPDSEVKFRVEGPDSEQADKVLNTLAARRFYVDDDPAT